MSKGSVPARRHGSLWYDGGKKLRAYRPEVDIPNFSSESKAVDLTHRAARGARWVKVVLFFRIGSLLVTPVDLLASELLVGVVMQFL